MSVDRPTNEFLTIAMGVVIVWMLAAAVRYMMGMPAISALTLRARL